jgi:protein-disulfide isomerase
MSFPAQANALGPLKIKFGGALATAALIAASALLTIASPPLPVPSAKAQTNTESRVVAAPVAGPASASGSGETTPFTLEQRQAIETIVRQYLLQNPEILVETSKELEKRQAALQAEDQKRIIVAKKARIFTAPSDFVLGNPTGDITVVEFFDYNCGWCKRAVDEVTKLVEADTNLRIVLKELPIFGDNSTFAAKAAMA